MSQENEKLKAALALNYCNVSISQIIDYNDFNILEQEYHAIINNVNLEQIIKDDSLLKLFEHILDTITYYRIEEGDRLWLDREYQNNIKNAIWDSVPQFNVIVSGGNPYTMVLSTLQQMGVGYFNYKRNINKYQMQREKGEWQLQKAVIEELNSLRKKFFATSWNLAKEYDFPDEWRLTEKQIQRYNEIIRDEDPLNRYERLKYLDNEFFAYPPFWYYKARAALELAHGVEEDGKADFGINYRQQARDALDKFHDNYVPILRTDVFASSALLDRVRMMDINKDRVEIKRSLDKVIRQAKYECDMMQICAFHYLSIDEPDEAINLLNMLINENYNLSMNGKLLSRVFFGLDRKTDYDMLLDKVGGNNVMEWEEKISNALLSDAQKLHSKALQLLDSYAETVGLIFANAVCQSAWNKISSYIFDHERLGIIDEFDDDCGVRLGGIIKKLLLSYYDNRSEKILKIPHLDSIRINHESMKYISLYFNPGNFEITLQNDLDVAMAFCLLIPEYPDSVRKKLKKNASNSVNKFTGKLDELANHGTMVEGSYFGKNNRAEYEMFVDGFVKALRDTINQYNNMYKKMVSLSAESYKSYHMNEIETVKDNYGELTSFVERYKNMLAEIDKQSPPEKSIA